MEQGLFALTANEKVTGQDVRFVKVWGWRRVKMVQDMNPWGFFYMKPEIVAYSLEDFEFETKALSDAIATGDRTKYDYVETFYHWIAT